MCFTEEIKASGYTEFLYCCRKATRPSTPELTPWEKWRLRKVEEEMKQKRLEEKKQAKEKREQRQKAKEKEELSRRAEVMAYAAEHPVAVLEHSVRTAERSLKGFQEAELARGGHEEEGRARGRCHSGEATGESG